MLKKSIIPVLLSLFCVTSLSAQNAVKDILPPIEQYIAKGDVEKLSQWFDNALEVTIFSQRNDSSCNQARQILQTFFNIYTPRSFKISHVVEKPNLEYALGALQAGGENFIVTLFITKQDTGSFIQQFKIDRKTGRSEQ